MVKSVADQNFSGTAKIWADFAAQNPGLLDDESFVEAGFDSEEFRDEYIRLPYDDVPRTQECHW